MVSPSPRMLHRPILLTAFTILFLLASPPPGAEALWALPLGQWSTLLSLSHSLMVRVANLRAERGDHAGSQRVRAVAEKLQFLGRNRGVWSLGWDYFRNYAWRRGGGLSLPLSEMREILSELRDLGELKSEEERIRWLSRNYTKLRSLTGSVFRRLLGSISREGPMHDTLVVLRRELVEGELARDCWEVGGKDLEGLATVARDLLFSYAQQSDNTNSDL